MRAWLTERVLLALRGRSWCTNLNGAPFDEALLLRVPAKLHPTGAKPNSVVGFRQGDRWCALSRTGQIVPVDRVEAWAPLSKGTPITQRSTTPNLFVLGAGKSGTTSLHSILRQHPDIHATKIKEPTFFCSYFQVVNDPVAYFRLFDSSARYRVESSHAYFSNPETALILKSLFPKAKFVISLRDPKKRADSLYRHMRRHTHPVDHQPYEDIPNFASALQAEDERYASQTFFDNCRQYFWNFLYCRSSLYDGQLQRYLSLFDRDQLHVLSLAELSADPISATEDIARFLDIDPSPVKRFTFDIKNSDPGTHRGYCSRAEAIMDAAFDGLTERTDAIVGRPLNWSL